MTGLSRRECPGVVFGISSLIQSHSTSSIPHESSYNIKFRCLVRALAVVALNPLIIGVLSIIAPLIQANASSPV